MNISSGGEWEASWGSWVGESCKGEISVFTVSVKGVINDIIVNIIYGITRATRLLCQDSMLLRKRQHHSNAENVIHFYLFGNDFKNGDLLSEDYLRHI